MCDVAGVRIEYLPPYSPDFNPIETTFTLLKKWMRGHQALTEAYTQSDKFTDFITLAIQEF